MAKQEAAKTLELKTLLVVRELADGAEVCFPVADPSLASYGRNGGAIVEQRTFLEEYLGEQRPEVIAGFSVPAGTRVEEIDVVLEREDLPPRLQLKHPITIGCIVVPHGRDQWAIVPAAGHTVHVGPDEDLRAVVREEVARMVAARELGPLELAQLFPPRAHRLEELTLEIDRSDRLLPARARELRKLVAERKRQRDALEVLASVGSALHRSEAILRGPPLVGRERELAELGALLGGRERQSVLLVGPSQCGKSALWHAWLRAHSIPRRLVFGVSASQLIAGMSGLGQWQARVQRVMGAAAELDALLYFDNLGEVFSDHPEGKLDVASAMRPFLEENKLRVVGEVHPETLARHEQRHLGFVSCLHRLRLEPLSAAQASEVLRARIEHSARRAPERPNLAPEAVPTLVELVERYLPYQAQPGKTVRLYEELRSLHEGRGCGDPAGAQPLGERELYEVFSLQTGVPLFLLRQDQALKLESATLALRHRLIGQQQAVQRVAETVCVVKARLQPAGKPLASFLFVGPTGVGKTELARSLAAYLFGSEARLARFDMSEFMDGLAAERLIQGSDRAEGLLTRRARQQPFSVLLLDEIEKAHPAVFDLLLQVCGEGRLTDAAGRTAHFSNAIIIMTSNLGAAARRAAVGLGASGAADDAGAAARYYEAEVSRAFRPEFVNRIDRIVTFQALTPEQIAQVTRLQLVRLAARRGLQELGVSLELDEPAVARLARDGYSAEYGARALRRHLEDSLVAPLAALLAGLGPRARGARVLVSEAGRPDDGSEGEHLARVEVAGLRVRVVRGGTGAGRRDAGGVTAIADLRRSADRYLKLPTASEVKEQIDFALTQLSARAVGRAASGASGGRDGRAAQELAELRTEHARLSELWERATARVKELADLEELALSALLSEEDPVAFAAEAQASYRAFTKALFYLMVARRRRRDGVTLLALELDQERALDGWLGPLLAELECRRWTLHAHVDGGARGPDDDWPAGRRWGPPRDAAWVRAGLESEKRPFRALLLRVSGPYAGAALALERGLHQLLSPDGARPALLHVRHIAERIALSDREWLEGSIRPTIVTSYPELKRLPPQRAYESVLGPCRVVGERSVELALGDYWREHELVAVQALLAFEEGEGRSIDQLYAPELLGAGPAAAREEGR